MRNIFLYLAISTMLAGACNSRMPKDDKTSEENRAVKRLLEEYYLTMSDRDWSKYEKFFSDDAILTTIWQIDSTGQPVIFTNTITDFLAQTEEGPDSQPIFEERLVESTVEVRGNLAVSWVRYEAKFGTEEDLMHWEGVDLISLIKHSGEWKIVSIVFESV